MNHKLNFVVITLAVYLSINSVSSLKCHVCSSSVKGQEDCFLVEPADTKYLLNCGERTNGSCRTQEQWVDFEVLGQKPTRRIIRQCAATQFDPSRTCYYRAGFGGKTNVCNCAGDGCNGASAAAAYSFLATLCFVLIHKMLM